MSDKNFTLIVSISSTSPPTHEIIITDIQIYIILSIKTLIYSDNVVLEDKMHYKEFLHI